MSRACGKQVWRRRARSNARVIKIIDILLFSVGHVLHTCGIYRSHVCRYPRSRLPTSFWETSEHCCINFVVPIFSSFPTCQAASQASCSAPDETSDRLWPLGSDADFLRSAVVPWWRRINDNNVIEAQNVGTFRRVNKSSLEIFYNVLSKVSWESVLSTRDAEEAYNIFLYKFITVYNGCFP